RKIAGHQDRAPAAARSTHFLKRGLAAFDLSRHENHRRAETRETDRGLLADARARAGDDDDLSGQINRSRVGHQINRSAQPSNRRAFGESCSISNRLSVIAGAPHSPPRGISDALSE